MERNSNMGELAKQAISEGTVHQAGMSFTHYATFECADPTGNIANYMKEAGE